MFGSERNLFTLSLGLSKSGHQTIIFILCFSSLKDKLEDKGIRVYDLNVRKIYNFHGLKQIIKIIRFVKREKIDIIVTYHEISDITGFIIGMATGVPVISNRRDMGFQLKRRHVLIYKIINRYFNKIITNSEAIKSMIVKKQNISPSKILTIYNGLDLSIFNKPLNIRSLKDELSIKADDKVVGKIASIRPIKGHKYFIEAAYLVLKEIPNTKFILVGCDAMESKAYFESLKKQINELGMNDNFVYLGYRSDIPQILSIMDISVLSSLSEGFSNTIIESMFAGVPVVATDVGGNSEAIDNKINGYLVPPADSKRLAECIINLLKYPNLAKIMGANGRKKVKELFSLDIMLKKHLDLYKQVISAKRNT